MTKKIKLSDITLDFNIYPRADVDSVHVTRMREAHEAGTTFPPLILDAKSLRAVEGFHRTTLYRQILQPEDLIECDLRRYKNEREMMLDAIRLNRSHGKPFSNFDRSRAACKARGFGATSEQVAGAFGIAVGRLDGIARGRASLLETNPDRVLKNTIRHMVGRKLTKKQSEVNKHLSGLNQLTYINTVINLLDAGLIDVGNDNVMGGLEKLHELLTEFLDKQRAA